MHTPRNRRIAAAIAALLLPAALPAAASTFGSLANFDAVNDTGHNAYGFEIEFEDASFYKTAVGSVFGYNRVFGFVSQDPLAVVRFGKVSIDDYNDAVGNHAGVRITYGGANGSIFTQPNDPASPYNTPGESCWPGASKGWMANPCDHFGVTTAGSPAVTRYNWLVEPTPGAGSSSLVKQVAGLPPVVFAPRPYVPPVNVPPPVVPPLAVVNIQIQAVAAPVELPEPEPGADPVDPGKLWGEAFWVKTYTTKLDRNIDLGNLLRGDEAMEAADVEMEWSILQKRPLLRDQEGANEVKEVEIELGGNDKAIMRRYEFYKYVGAFDPDGMGEAFCDSACEDDPTGALGGPNTVGNFVGAQMAGFNADGVAAVPEPQTWALMLAGLAGLATLAKRRRG